MVLITLMKLLNNMKKFKSITKFVDYCEEINENQDDSVEFFLISTLAATLTKEELLLDAEEALNEYYKWLSIAVDSESFYVAGTIFNAKESEMAHYMDLGKAVLKKTIKKDIINIDKAIKLKYLGY
jgi:hypothetical protein